MFNVIKIETKVEQPRNNTRRQNSQFHFEKLFFTSEISRCKSYKYASDFITYEVTKRKEKERGNICARRQSIAHMGDKCYLIEKECSYHEEMGKI